MKKTSLGAILLVCCLLTTCFGCTIGESMTGDVRTTAGIAYGATPTPVFFAEYLETATPVAATPVVTTVEQIAYGGWVPYWDYANAVDEVDELGDLLSYAVCFGAIFNADDQPFLLPDVQEALTCLNILYSKEHTIYLSVVNDIELEDDVYENKSSDLLWRILEDDETIDAHIEDLMALLIASGADGLEIDYEAIQSDVALWQRFVTFIERLYARTQSEGYLLRVVLTWDAARYATFPDGPQYSIMCYNLYGSHSGAGPKADRAFLQKVFSVNQTLPGSPAIAFATGGFDWGDDGSVVSLTQSEAVALQKDNGVSSESVSRDSESAVLNFTYFDEDGLFHEVWYADGETLAYWRSLALEAGFTNFDLFRLGGNSTADLVAFFGLTSFSTADAD